jgi:trehalose 6-phosphate synthase
MRVALKREPTSAGPITELFDQLHELHLRAGEPGVRQIATGIGRGVLSYTTVHNVFRGPRVPKWGHLDLIVEQLGGDRETFHTLGTAARLAERASAASTGSGQGITEASARDDRPAVDPSTSPSRRRDSSAIRNHGGENRQYEFVVVSHRWPVADAAAGQWASRGGRANVTLSELVKTRHGAWVGWSGRSGDGPGPAGPEDMSLYGVELSARDVEQHYEGYCLSTIWPLYHGAIERPEFRRSWREANRAVNQRFAGVAAQVAAPGAIVWIHDFHLQLVPAMLRRLRPDLKVGFFLHIPLPPVEMFLRLPGRAETLRGLLGADLVGFQRPLAVQNFLRLCGQVLGLQSTGNAVHVDGRTVVVEALPISVDVTEIERVVARPQTQQRAKQIRAELGNPRTLFVGLDRLDYTKGVEQRLSAYGELLQEGRLLPETSAFIQVSTLSREQLTRYAQLRQRVERLVGHLNGTYGRVGSPVVHYTQQSYDFNELVALYAAADVMIVTPLSDGMNLVAKEYVASRVDNRGMLVLSEFAGAAAELDQAVLVNPYDLDDLKNAIRPVHPGITFRRAPSVASADRLPAGRRHPAQSVRPAVTSSHRAACRPRVRFDTRRPPQYPHMPLSAR